MRKRILSFMIPILLTVLLLPVSVRAAAVPDTSRKCSLSIQYAREAAPFAGVEISAYRVADYLPNGIYGLVPPFSGYSVNINGISSQTEWDSAAATLWGHVVSDKLSPTASVKTDENGIANFEDLQTGLYLIPGVTVSDSTGSWQYRQFLVFLPSPAQDGSLNYDLEVRPKQGIFIENRELTVRKLWIDTGYTDQRPASVTVALYQNDTLRDTKILNAQNNWSYTWVIPGGTDTWTVVEQNVPENYDVALSVSGNVHTLTNTYIPPVDPDDATEPTESTDPTSSSTETTKPNKPSYPSNKPPKTGDSFPLIPCCMAMCISGLLLLILGIWRRRFTR